MRWPQTVAAILGRYQRRRRCLVPVTAADVYGDARAAQDLILRYATVTLMREICDRKGITKRTRAAVAAIEGEIVARLPARIEELEGRVKRLR